MAVPTARSDATKFIHRTCRVRVRVHVRARACVRADVRTCVRAYVRTCVLVRVCVYSDGSLGVGRRRCERMWHALLKGAQHVTVLSKLGPKLGDLSTV